MAQGPRLSYHRTLYTIESYNAVTTGNAWLSSMPELPDITVYIEALENRILGETLEGVRLHWRERGAKLARKNTPAVFDFSNGTLVLTEAGSQKRASLHLVSGEDGLRTLDPGGIEVLEADLPTFASALTSANHTLKRALSDPRTFSGIGNAYSDEILHRARLS